MVSFASAGILGLLRRSLVTSAHLDSTIAGMDQGETALAEGNGAAAGAAETIARLTDARAVAIFTPGAAGKPRLAAGYGAVAEPGNPPGRAVTVRTGKGRAARFYLTQSAGEPESHEMLVTPLGDAANGAGTMVIAHDAGRKPSAETVQLAAAIAAGVAGMSAESDPALQPWWRLPHGVEAKAQSLARLNQRILARARFFDSAFRSVEDGLVLAGADGRITFVNRRAAAVLGSNEKALIGRNLFERLAEAEGVPAAAARDSLTRLVLDRAPTEREITVLGVRPRHYILRVAAVSGDDDANGAVLGIVASLSDITRQHELHQTKNDVMALVSHEMRTPLSAIQGMSELLAQYDLDPERRREMNLAINDEAKRLTRMITEYLDITRLEAGATVLRRLPVRIESLVERSLLLLDPLAGQKNIRLTRAFESGLAAIVADGDLISRTVGNLVSNAIKYSRAGTEVTVSVRAEREGVVVEIEDQGPGIPAADLDRIFEKFYRVPRAEDADTPGTGLGLALVREVAELHGGCVTVVSTVGTGSTFTLYLPRTDESHA
jgi:PAS domain S-box-containing protein